MNGRASSRFWRTVDPMAAGDPKDGLSGSGGIERRQDGGDGPELIVGAGAPARRRLSRLAESGSRRMWTT